MAAGLVLGVVNAALPFTLIAWGETHIDSGVAAIANATVPLFNALLVIRFLPSERLSGRGSRASRSASSASPCSRAVTPAAAGGASRGRSRSSPPRSRTRSGGIYGQIRVRGTSGPVLAAAAMIGGSLWLLPLAVVQAPADVPSWKAVGLGPRPRRARDRVRAARPLPRAALHGSAAASASSPT